jgi:hypothetical protein
MGTEARLGFGITRRDTVMANDEVGDVAQVEGAAAKGLRMGERRKCMPDHDATGCASWVDVGLSRHDEEAPRIAYLVRYPRSTSERRGIRQMWGYTVPRSFPPSQG